MPNQAVLKTRLEAGSFTACIVVDGQELPLHGVDETAGQHATCWVASEAGKIFSVKWRDSDESLLVRTMIHIDGLWCGSPISTPVQPTPNAVVGRWFERNYCLTAETSKRHFVFADIEPTDDDAYLDQEVPEKLGTITLSMSEVMDLGRMPPVYCTADKDAVTKVHERSKKAMGHQMRLGNEVPCPPPPMYWDLKPIRELATFTFKYRPRGFLQANDIIPQAIQPQQFHAVGGVIDLTEEPDDVGTGGSRKTNNSHVKTDKSAKRPNIKRERPERRPETIDLTLSESD